MRLREWRKWRWWQWVLLVPLAIFLSLFLFAALSVGPWGNFNVEFGTTLLLGWLPFVGRVLPEVEVNYDLLWSGVGGALLAGVLVQRVMRWFVAGWSARQTVAVMSLMGAMFAASICGSGIVHQAIWLGQKPMSWDVSRGVVTRETNNQRQLYMALKLYAADHDGAYPETLEMLVEDGILDELAGIGFSRDTSREIIEPVAYYGEGLKDSSSGKCVLLASAGPYYSSGTKRVVATNDGSVRTCTEEQFREMLAARSGEGLKDGE